ncbi:MAG: immunoglobulin-like domain-containing protein, partial [Peptostreptococcaceae bacterium]
VIDSDGNITTKDITVVVRSNQAPTINANDVNLKVGDSFDPLTANNGLVANDQEDGDITSEITVVSNNVDTNTAGVYSVIYQVVDSDGNTTYKEIQVVVETNEVPTIDANDVSIKEGDTFDPLNANNNLVATDVEDGDITGDITVLSSNVDTSTPGTYQVTYQVIDSDGNITTKDITVVVRSNQAPTINANDVNLKVGDSFDPLDANNNLVATDQEDNDLTNQIQVASTNVDTTTPGVYHVIYCVEDSDGNITYYEIQVMVRTNQKPVIEAEDVTIKEGDTFDPLNANNNLVATDVEDGDITNQIQVYANNVNPNKEGVYSVEYSVEDSDGNISYKEILVTVRSNQAPIITANPTNIIIGEQFD